MLAVIDGFFWNAHLPWSIEAVIGSPGDLGAVRLHERFLASYHITKADVPLVTFHKEEADCPFRPFDATQHMDADERFDYRVNGIPRTWIAPSVRTFNRTSFWDLSWGRASSRSRFMWMCGWCRLTICVRLRFPSRNRGPLVQH